MQNLPSNSFIVPVPQTMRQSPRVLRLVIATYRVCLAFIALQVTACASPSTPIPAESEFGVDATLPDWLTHAPMTGTAVVSGDAWVRTHFQPTLFQHEHNEDEQCPGLPYREEYGGVEINTGRCHEITLTQPSLIAVSAGEKLRIIAWHSQLISEDTLPQTGTMMLAIGEQLVWAEQSPIPGEARSFDIILQTQVDIARGDPVRIHVHNHGANAWNLLSLEKVE